MKRNVLLLLVVCILAFGVLGCATPYPMGMLYTEIKSPVAVGSGDISYNKVGTATSNSYFGLIATGDSSIEAARSNGGIRDIKYVDYKSENILGVIGTYTTTVYGD